MTEAVLRNSKNRQKYLRSLVTQITTKVNTRFNQLTEEDKLFFIDKLKSINSELGPINQLIFGSACREDEDSDTEELTTEQQELMERNEQYEDQIGKALIKLEGRTLQGQSVNVTQPQVSSITVNTDKIKLPPVSLPIFDDEQFTSVEKFIHRFESLIEKHKLNDDEKIALLVGQLRGHAKDLIESLDEDGEAYTYEDAKEWLYKAYDSPPNRKYKAIKTLTEMKMTYEMHPNKYLAQINTITKTFTRLNIDVETVLEYFIIQGMNDRFQDTLVGIVNKNRPSLTEIMDNYFEVTERYLKTTEKINARKNKSNFDSKQNYANGNKSENKNEKQVVGLATNVATSSKPKMIKCILCTKDGKEHVEHKISQCPVYVDPKSKLDKLQSTKCCTKCALGNHLVHECKHKFSYRCIKCKKWHYTFLCVSEGVNPTSHANASHSTEGEKGKKKNEGNQSQEGEKNKKETKTTANVANIELEVQILRNSVGGESLIPTFTTGLGNGHSGMVRIMLDSGCEHTFIDEKLVTQHNFKVLLDNITLKVKGINKIQRYNSKLVEVPLKVGEQIYYIDAFCLPEIDLDLKHEKVKPVVDELIKRAYKLADKLLVDEVNNDTKWGIDIILGTDCFYALEYQPYVFGEGKPSVIWNSPLGVLLTGHIERLVKNVKHLPYQNKEIKSIEIENQVARVEGGNSDSFDMNNLSVGSVIDNSIVEKAMNGDCPMDDKVSQNDKDSDLTNLNDELDILAKVAFINELENDQNKYSNLDEQCSFVMSYDNSCDEIKNENYSEVDIKIADYVLDNMTRNESGRVFVPLMWNNKIESCLSQNYNLSKKVLNTTRKKHGKVKGNLEMIDSVFKEQETMGIIEKIYDVDKYVHDNPDCKFLPHMAIVKPERDTTKCRVVFLSNLKEKNGLEETFSHNQAMLPGPCLNQKITTALMLLRFNEFIITYDIKKAFLNIGLNANDQNRLLFLWYRNVAENDYNLIAYKNLRLSFGLKCSPSLLTLCLFKILIIDAENDCDEMAEFKKELYDLLYVDNGAYSANSIDKLKWAFKELSKTFEPYQFFLQQFVTNNKEFQAEIDEQTGKGTDEEVKLLGMVWNRMNDSLKPKKINVSPDANTKRLILQNLHAIYDVFGIYLPMLNRSKLFLQKLLSDKNLGWDTTISMERQQEWHKIAKQLNNSKAIEIDRYVGDRDSNYELTVFTDSSTSLYGAVVYLIDQSKNKVHFLIAKNRVLNAPMKGKTIPSLELHAICFGVELLIDTYKELTGGKTVIPIKINKLSIFSDSMVSLNRIKAYNNQFAKIQKQPVFVQNRLSKLNELCQTFPVHFKFIGGMENPSDHVTREVSYKRLVETNFHSGPSFLTDPTKISQFETIVIPNPVVQSFDEVLVTNCANINELVETNEQNKKVEHLIPLDRFSSFHKLATVYKRVIKVINNFKRALQRKGKFLNHKVYDYTKDCMYLIACKQIIARDQEIEFPEIVEYFQMKKPNLKDVPMVVNQLNLFKDKEDELLKVKSKFKDGFCVPTLLSKTSLLTTLIIRDQHIRMDHVGVYSLLKELRQRFWIVHYFTAVKQVLKKCIDCRRQNSRAISLNQGLYRDFRVTPPSIPFYYVMVDFIGPHKVKIQGEKQNAWILIFTCLWSRAINLKVCLNANTHEFLRMFQLHVFDFGLPELCISDQGSQIKAGTKLITQILNDEQVLNYFDEKNIKTTTFDEYSKGNSAQGSLVESMVKVTKKLIYGAIKNIVLDFTEYQFIVAEVNHLANKRPIAFKEKLRDNLDSDVLDAITPELLIKGFETNSVNIVPNFQTEMTDDDEDWKLDNDHTEIIRKKFEKIQKVRKNVKEKYQSEFLANLVSQATNQRDRYKQSPHQRLAIGDIVLLKDQFCKPNHFPMGIVKAIDVNSLGEVTSATVMKGQTRELVYRHVSSLILLVPNESCSPDENNDDNSDNDSEVTDLQIFNDDTSNGIDNVAKNDGNNYPTRKKRAAAQASQDLLHRLIKSDLV